MASPLPLSAVSLGLEAAPPAPALTTDGVPALVDVRTPTPSTATPANEARREPLSRTALRTLRLKAAPGQAPMRRVWAHRRGPSSTSSIRPPVWRCARLGPWATPPPSSTSCSSSRWSTRPAGSCSIAPSNHSTGWRGAKRKRSTGSRRRPWQTRRRSTRCCRRSRPRSPASTRW